MAIKICEHIPSEIVRWLPDTRCDFLHAEWISLPKTTARCAYFLARKEFTCYRPPGLSIVHISADLFYRLYVNGCFIDYGPPRNTTTTMSYRSFDISGLICLGKNVLAAEVYQSPDQIILHRSYRSTRRDSSPCVERMGLIVQLDQENPHGTTTGTGPDWRVMPGESWETEARLSSAYSQAEIYNSEKEPIGWREAGFDDNAWLEPESSLAQYFFSDVPEELRPYKILEPAITPPLKRSIVQAESILTIGEVTEIDATIKFDIGQKMGMESISRLETCHIEGVENLLLPGWEPAVFMNAFSHRDMKGFYSYWDQYSGFPSVRNASIVVDFGRIINGHFLLDVEAQDGIIDIAWGQMLIDGRIMPKLYSSEDNGSGFNLSHACRYRISNGKKKWESFHYQQFRYIQFTFREMRIPVVLHGLAAIRTEAILEDKGDFSCSDETLSWLWRASRNTLRLCTHDLPMDNIVRERGIYSGDVAGAIALSGPYCFGDTPFFTHLTRLFARDRGLRRFLLTVLDAHLTQPFNGEDAYFCHPLLFSLELIDCRHHADKPEEIRDHVYPALRAYAEYLLSMLNAQGVAEQLPGNQWIDWADVDNAKGIGTPQNLLIALFLRKLTELSDEYADTDFSARCRQSGKIILDFVFDHLWNEHEGLYADSLVGGIQRIRVFSEHTNYLALLTDLGRNGREESIIENLALEKDNRVRSDVCYFMIYPAKALFHIGRDREAMRLISSRYDRIHKTGSETIWEEWSPLMSIRSGTWFARYRSIAQGGATGQAGILSAHVLGIRPTRPRFEEFFVDPQTGTLSWAEGRVPTPFGIIWIRWEKRDGLFLLNLEFPGGTVAEVRLPPASGYSINDISQAIPVVHESSWPEGSTLRIPPGNYRFLVHTR